MADSEIEELRRECGYHAATANALARHLESLAAEVSDEEVEAFRRSLGVGGFIVSRSRVSKLLKDFIAKRQYAGQFQAFGLG